MKKVVITLLLVATTLSTLFAFDDSLYLSGVPVIYGEESFVRRIEENTQGREPVGLVLSGGSARALAHIGVLKYLEEKGIVPDFIVGNSMGSIVGLLYGYGMSPDQILSVLESVDIGTLFDLSLPINRGMINADRFKAFLKEVLGDKDLRVENTKIPVMVVCEDLVSKRMVCACEGDFYDVMLASFALPVYFSAVEYRDHLLVDGAVANAVPVNAAYEYTDNVIVSTTFYSNPYLNLRNGITALNTAFDIGKRRTGFAELSQHPEAVWIRCNVENYSFMQFSAGVEIAHRGYESCEAVREELEAIEGGNGPDGLYEFREAFQPSLEKAVKHFKIFNFSTEPGTSLFPVISGKTYGGDKDFSFTRKDTTLGTGIRFTTGNFMVQATVGGAFSLDSDNLYVKGIANVFARQYFLDRFELAADFTWYFSNEFGLLQTLRYNFDMPDNWSLKAGEKFEVHGDGYMVVSGLCDLDYSSEFFKANLYAEGGLSGGHGYVFASAWTDWYLRRASMCVSLGADFEKHFDDSAAEYSVKTRIDYLFPRDITFGEILIFQNTRTGVYMMAGGSNSFVFREAGVSLTTDLGLIGLRNVPVEILAGYQFNNKRVHVAFEAQL
ncbi:MAG: patatin-like phospholipase family protein [Sphaerochaetaceae bacterium]|nr:patatin-like phospholipase family protein [Sphaerochaetaceae bacterium]